MDGLRIAIAGVFLLMGRGEVLRRFWDGAGNWVITGLMATPCGLTLGGTRRG